MSTQRLIRITGLALVISVLSQTGILAANSRKMLLETRAFELKGPTENLEDEKLDFRYSLSS